MGELKSKNHLKGVSMVFISMNLDLSLEECLRLYSTFLKEFNPCQLMKELNLEGKVNKNGTRKKVYKEGDKKYTLTIQRMVFNNYYYFDLFPLLLMPNSTSLTMDFLTFDKEYKLLRRRNITKLDILNNQMDLFNIKGFYLLYRTKKFLVYKSYDEFDLNFRKGRIQKPKKKRYTFIIYLLSSAQASLT